MRTMEYGGRVLITGCGAVAQTLLPLLFKHLPLPPSHVTVIDFANREAQLRPWLEKGLVRVRERVAPTSLSRLLSSHVPPGGLIIDLAWSIDCFDILEWARRHEVLYVNAALESWDPSAEMHSKSTLDKASYKRYVRLLELAPSCREAATAVIDHGLNPGLISHFVKHGLLDIVRENGRAAYRPTVHYAYLPSNEAMMSLHELRCRNYELHPRTRILTDEIVEGEDIVGALIMGHRYRSWWTGSHLSIAEARKSVPHANATEVQVAAGVLAAILWMLRYPRQGLCFPEDLPHAEILRHARPYLGRIVPKATA